MRVDSIPGRRFGGKRFSGFAEYASSPSAGEQTGCEELPKSLGPLYGVVPKPDGVGGAGARMSSPPPGSGGAAGPELPTGGGDPNGPGVVVVVVVGLANPPGTGLGLLGAPVAKGDGGALVCV